MKQVTNSLGSFQLITALLAGAAIFVPSTLRAGSCAVPDTSKWRMITFTGNAAANAESENFGQAVTESSAEDASKDGDLNRRTPSIAGLWKVTFYDDQNNVADVAFDAWHSDGTEILNDYVSPLLGNVCLGVFAETGERAFRLKHPSWVYDK